MGMTQTQEHRISESHSTQIQRWRWRCACGMVSAWFPTIARMRAAADRHIVTNA